MSKLNNSYYKYFLFRIIFGCYLFAIFIYFSQFSIEIIPQGGANPTAPSYFPFSLFPNILNVLTQSIGLQSLYFFSAFLSILFIFDKHRTIVCMFLWYFWACTFNRFNFLISPGTATVGWLLLLNAIIPKSINTKDWKIPNLALVAAWTFMFFLYLPSGMHKLYSPSWIEGHAIHLMMEFPLARANDIQQLILNNRAIAKIANDYTIYSEILFGILVFSSKTRPFAWLLTFILHVSILSVISFEFITLSVLMMHIFTFDWKWIVHDKQQR